MSEICECRTWAYDPNTHGVTPEVNGHHPWCCKQSPPAPERYTGREIDHVILGYEDRIESKIIRQLQRDLEELKAECLPWLQCLLPDNSDIGFEDPSELEQLQALIQKLGAK